MLHGKKEFSEKFTFEIYNNKDRFLHQKRKGCFYIGTTETCQSNPNELLS